MKSLATSNSLQPKLHRPKVSFKVVNHIHEAEDDDSMVLAKESDPLPIVELKPFVQKVWRREKSFVNTSDRNSNVTTEKSEKSQTSRGTTGSRSKESEIGSATTFDGNLEEMTTPSPPPRTSHSLPPRITERYLAFYVNAFSDFKSQKEHFNRFVGESGFKPKTRLHPVIDPKTKKQAEHSVSIIPGFITREDRTKTTLYEISEGESTSRFYSCSPKAIGPEEIRKQQQIRVSGETVCHFRRTPPIQNSPTPSKMLNNSWHVPAVRHGSPASMLYHHRRKDTGIKRAKTPLYDYLDRSGALPSLSINATSLKKKSSRKADDNHSEDYTDYRDAFESELKHSIGGIENSLVILSKHGAPTKVERQISFELENNLSRFRKLKDYSPFEINPSELAKYYPSPIFNMTQGEMYIRQAMQSNASRRRHKKELHQLGISKEPTISGLSGDIPSQQLVHGILKKSFNEIEHIDSFENMYSPYDKLSNIQYTPDEEPQAPFDTPRSQTEAPASVKVTGSKVHSQKAREENRSTKDRSEKLNVPTNEQNTVEDHVLVIDTETQTPVTPIPDVIKKEQKDELSKGVHREAIVENCDVEEEPSVNVTNVEQNVGIDMTAVQMKTVQPQPRQIDASGRTFITSDEAMSVGLVSG